MLTLTPLLITSVNLNASVIVITITQLVGVLFQNKAHLKRYKPSVASITISADRINFV